MSQSRSQAPCTTVKWGHVSRRPQPCWELGPDTHTGDGPVADPRDHELAQLPCKGVTLFLSRVPSAGRRRLHSNGP